MASFARRVDEHVGERIRTRRTELGLTQDDLASELDISYQQVQKYETGANRVSAGRLYQIARKLDVDVAFFFTGAELIVENAPEGKPMAHGGTGRSTIEIARNFAEIPDANVRSAINGLIKSLIRQED
jgi:transcriptional regulator with XRE-family HTH domain